MLKKHVFLPLALVFAAAACAGADVDAANRPIATTGGPENGQRSFGSLTPAERKDLKRCVSDGANAAIKDFHKSDAYKNTTTTEERNGVMMNAIQKAISESKADCAAKFKIDSMPK